MNKIYYRIVETEDHVELHVSADKAEVTAEVGLSKRIHKNNPQKKEIIEEWEERMRNYVAHRV